MPKDSKIKIRKGTKNLDKYSILEDYIEMKLSVSEIATKHNTTVDYVEKLILDLYKKFQNARESRYLLATVNRPDLFAKMSKEYLDSTQINQEFLSLLSDPEDIVLSENEALFCHLLIELGDDIKAIDQSHLAAGLKTGTGSNCTASKRLRAIYLKKKPNVASYLKELQKQKIEVLQNSKEYIQTTLIETIEQMKNRGDGRDGSNILKALDSLAKTTGDYAPEKIEIDAGGDNALDRILNKAKEAKEAKKTMLAYSSEEDGIEIYE